MQTKLHQPIAIYAAQGISAGQNSSASGVLQREQTPPQLTQCDDNIFGTYKAAAIQPSLNAQIQEWAKSSKARQRADRVGQLAGYVTSKILSDSDLRLQMFSKLSLLVGSSRGATTSLESALRTFLETGKVPTHTSPTTTLGALTSCIAQESLQPATLFGLSATCTSGLTALIQGIALLDSDQAEACIAVGTEAPITPFTHAILRAAGVLASAWDTPFPCTPLAHEHAPGSGMILGEGAAAFLLARLHESKIPAPPLAVISGFATAMEKTPSPTGISEDATGLQDTMKQAVEMSGGIVPDLIIAHAPGTRKGDASELRAIEAVFGLAESRPAIYSPKWFLGHTLGASGSLSLLLGIELLTREILPLLPY
ncbi:MAG: beta-ketoacyl synthase N-terminal-like domain-containing protein, partial [Bdellovibrionota bacterium]